MFSHQWSTSVPASALPTLLFLLCRFLSHACFLFYSAWFPFSVPGSGLPTSPTDLCCKALLTGVFWSSSFYYFIFISLF